MITHIVTRENADRYSRELEDMFRLRHRFFVEGKGWENIRRADGLERDQFDTEYTIYLLLIENGRVIGCHRAMPTMKPHMFTDVFPDLCNVYGIQRASDIYEAGRTCLDEALVAPSALPRARQILMAGLFEFCCRAELSKFTCLCPFKVLHKYLRIGLSVTPLGIPKEFDGIPQVAAAFPTSESDVAQVFDAFGISSSVVTYVGAPEPAVAMVTPHIWDQPSALASVN